MSPDDTSSPQQPLSSSSNAIVPATPPIRPPRLKHLDGFRFIVSLWLVVGHNYDPNVLGSGTLAERFCFRRYVAVSFFLVLSGFVSQYAYGRRDFSQPGVLKNFYVGRIGSVLACYYATMAVALILKLASPTYSYANKGKRWEVGLPLILTLTQTWVPGYAYFGSPPAWTMSTLVAHWAVFPLLQKWLLRAEEKKVRVVVAGLPLLALMPICIALVVQGGQLPGRQWYLFYTHPLSRLPDFAYGAALSEVFVRKFRADNDAEKLVENMAEEEAHKPKPCHRVSIPFLADLVFPFIIALILAVPYSGRQSAFDSIMIFAPMHLFGLLIVGTSLDPGKSCTARVFSLEPCRQLGDFAFQVYLWRYPLFAAVCWIQNGKFPNAWVYLSPVYFLPSFFILYFFSYAWYRYIDDPLRRYLTSASVQPEKATQAYHGTDPTMAGNVDKDESSKTINDAQAYQQVV